MKPSPSPLRAAAGSACVLILLLATCERPNPTAPEHRGPAASPVNADVTSGPAVLVGAGDIVRCDATNDEATASILDTIAGTVFTLGDNVLTGTDSEYNNCYGASWGRHKDRTLPTPGEMDYTTAGAPGYYKYFGAAAGDPTKGYYSYEAGDWHVIVLNTEVAVKAGSPQEQWLRADLAAHPNVCTLAYFHRPLFYSGGTTGTHPEIKPLWDALYAAGVELVLNGHQRHYERFAPQKPDGTADPTFGIREIIAATGGQAHGSFGTTAPNSEVRDRTSYGVLKVTLSSGSYAWQFIPIKGATFTDAGSGTCHGAPGSSTNNNPPTAAPGGPYTGVEGTAISFNGSGSSDPDGDTPLSYLWSFGDGSTGTGATPTHAYADNGTFTVSLTVTDSRGAASTAVTTSATVTNVKPTVNAGADAAAGVGTAFTLSVSFTDPGSSDAPWAYSIDWGDGSAATTGNTSSRTTPISASHTYTAAGTFTVPVTVTDKDGGAGVDTTVITVSSAPPPPPPPPPGTPVLVGAGDIAKCSSHPHSEETAQILDTIPGTVYTIGDNAYPDGSAAQFANCYDPTWGRHKSRTRPTAGNIDYNTTNATPYYNYFGSAAGDPSKGYYSYDVGTWHIIVLNDNIEYKAGSAQEQWLRADLAAHPALCTLAMWHRPRYYSSGSTGDRTSLNAFWNPLYAAGAEIVLNGHVHQYERYAPQDPNGNATPNGIREFIVGTGGEGLGTPGTPHKNVEVLDAKNFGVLKITLEDGAYSWQFISTAGGTNHDSGRQSCH
ncbi:MAG TPA: PKD domain-containing protein [Gemmatimonadaceae bacterium]|nr:PKD domain-containing protein [Gemmatimonadaceae bacterium]